MLLVLNKFVKFGFNIKLKLKYYLFYCLGSSCHSVTCYLKIFIDSIRPIGHKTNPVRSDSFGLNSLQIFGVRLWRLLPDNIKYSNSLEVFKEKIKSWKPNCPCKLCATFIKGVGYIDLQIRKSRECLIVLFYYIANMFNIIFSKIDF